MTALDNARRLLRHLHNKGNKADFLIDTHFSPILTAAMREVGAQVLVTEAGNIFIFGYKGYLPHRGSILSGHAVMGDRLVQGPCFIDSHDLGAGDWIVLSYDDKNIEVRCDAFSSSPVYVGMGIVSTNLNIVHFALELMGKRRVNLDVLASQFLTNNAFTSQSCAFGTPIQGVSMIPTGACVKVSREIEVAIEEVTADKLSHEEYWSLMQEAVGEICNNIVAAVKSSPKVISGLSGGRDSRAVYAAILATGNVNNVRFVTNDIGRDLEISLAILSAFGGNYDADPADYISSLPVDFGIERYIAYNSFSNHRYHRHVNDLYYLKVQPQILLGGGSGEVYRGFYRDIVDACSSPHFGRDAALSAVRFWLEGQASRSICKPELGIESSISAFCNLPGSDVTQLFMSHYLNFRNKFHFSNKVPFGQKIDFSPLQSKALLEISRRVSGEVLASGRIMFDLTSLLCEDLALFEYDKRNDIDFSKVDYHRDSVRKSDFTLASSVTIDYEKMPRTNLKSQALARPKSSPSLFEYSKRGFKERCRLAYKSGLFSLDESSFMLKAEKFSEQEGERFFKFDSRIRSINWHCFGDFS